MIQLCASQVAVIYEESYTEMKDIHLYSQWWREKKMTERSVSQPLAIMWILDIFQSGKVGR